MRVNSRLLYWGVVLVAIGGVLVAADLRAIDTSTLTEALRLWPLAVVAVGLSIVLRRTQLSLPALLLAAALPGFVVGAAFAIAPRFVGDCGSRGEATSFSGTQGTFDGPATVSIKSACASLAVKTAPGNGWQLTADTAARTPSVEA